MSISYAVQTPNCRSIKSARVTVVPVVILAMLVPEVAEVTTGGDLSEDVYLLVDSFLSVTADGEVTGEVSSEDVNFAEQL